MKIPLLQLSYLMLFGLSFVLLIHGHYVAWIAACVLNGMVGSAFIQEIKADAI